MGRIPLEDNYDDVLNKAQRGLGITDELLAARADVSVEDLLAIKSGKFNEAVTRRVSAHLRLHRDSMVQLARKTWYPTQPVFTTGFAAFNTPMEGMTVNSFLIWDERTKLAAAFDTGASCEPMLDVIQTERLRLRYVFITHTHEDHIADLPKLVEASGAEVWSSAADPLAFPGGQGFRENAFFHIGPLAIKTLYTPGHAKSGTTFYITGLSYPLAVVGDSLFSCSMGGAPADQYYTALDNNKTKIFTLPADTVLACGHGPVTTVAQERRNNPFFAR